LSWDVAKLMGFKRARAVAVGRRKKLGRPLPNDPLITEDDFRCDAEQVEVERSGRITKSPPPEITKLNGT
jgi:hypothetical protein